MRKNRLLESRQVLEVGQAGVGDREFLQPERLERGHAF